MPVTARTSLPSLLVPLWAALACPAPGASAELASHIVAAAGEAYRSAASDIGGSTGYPEIGADLSLRALGAVEGYAEAFVGRLNEGGFYDAAAGMRAGWTISGIRPELLWGYGYQSYRNNHWVWDPSSRREVETFVRHSRSAWLCGARISVLDRFTAEWEGRVRRSMPNWRVKFGWRWYAGSFP